MIYVTEFFLLAISVMEAWWHSVLIKDNKPILHGLWAALYIFLVGSGYWVIHPLSTFLLFAIACFAGHLVVFNLCLNRFRGLPWNYISKTSTSIVDKLEYRLFGTRVWIVEMFATLLFITLQLYL